MQMPIGSGSIMENRMKTLSPGAMRDVILLVHQMAHGSYIQSDAEMRKRIAAACDAAIEKDDPMRGLLGRGGPCPDVLSPAPGAPDPLEVGYYCQICGKALDEYQPPNTKDKGRPSGRPA